MSIENSKIYNELKIKRIDIKGQMCPMTFVYTKLALEELSKGDILEVELDFLHAIKNIPENCKRQNLADLLEVKEINPDRDIWLLKLKKL
ncbi:MAG: sulfurtransferase TusA family protein [Candidatus Hermodarchaeota archaeon]